MESEYSGNLESVWGINTTSTTSSDRFSIVASPCCCRTPTPTTRIPLLHIHSTSKPTGRTSVVPVASRPFSVFPPFSGTQMVPRPIASPPSGDPVIPVENLIDTSVSLNVTPNQTEFRAWINGRVHQSFGLKDTMVHYISRLLDVAKYTVADLQDLKTSQVWPKRPWTGSRWQTTIVLLSVANPRIQASSQDSRSPPTSPTKSKSSVEPWSYWARYDFPHIKSRRS